MKRYVDWNTRSVDPNDYCEYCHDTGLSGDMGPGGALSGNLEYGPCDCDPVARAKRAIARREKLDLPESRNILAEARSRMAKAQADMDAADRANDQWDGFASTPRLTDASRELRAARAHLAAVEARELARQKIPLDTPQAQA